MISIYWIIQIGFDIVLLVLFLMLLKNRNQNSLDHYSETMSQARVSNQQDSLDQLETLQETLETLVTQVEKTTDSSLKQLQQLIEKAEENRISLREDVHYAQEALRTLEQLVPRADTEISEDAEIDETDKDEVEREETKAEIIMRLHRQGVDVEQIAKQLAIGRGEVHLVLDLHRAGKQND